MNHKPINKEFAYRWMPEGAHVRCTRTDLIGNVRDVRKNPDKWWETQYKIVSDVNTDDFTWAKLEEIEYMNPWVEYERRLKAHDWTYAMSDAYDVYQKGSAALKDLKYRRGELSKLDKERAEALYDEYQKRGWGGGPVLAP